jgi:hypothetical protein
MIRSAKSIPAFPAFKKVDLADQAAVRSMTATFPPYSDFTFTSLWAWDTAGERGICDLNGNLVVRFTDYGTQEPFLSFLGTHRVEQTARTLIDYSRANGLPLSLRLVPEISIKDMETSAMRPVEDRDNFDYVYSIPELSALRGGQFKRSRNFVNRFRHDHPGARVEPIDLNDKGAQRAILSVLRAWELNKAARNKEHESKHEETAIQRVFEAAASHQLSATGVFLDTDLLAFGIEEILSNCFCIGHFWKADTTYTGIYDFLLQERARHLEAAGLAFWNYEQDLGVHGLRRSKLSYRPIHFLKKYRVALTNST